MSDAPVNLSEVKYLGDLQRMQLMPGDRLVFSVDAALSEEDAKRIKDAVEALIPGHDCLVLSKGMKIGIIGEGNVS